MAPAWLACGDELNCRALLGLPRDAALLFVTRSLRTFSFGALGPMLAIYCRALQLTDAQLGAILSFSLIGDAAFSFTVSAVADKLGRRWMLILGAFMKFLSAVPLGLVQGPQFWVVLAGATIGVLSPSGGEVGPFRALEQSIISQLVDKHDRTHLFAWYSFVGALCTAFGNIAGGTLVAVLIHRFHWPELLAYKVLIAYYGCTGLVLMGVFCFLSEIVELPKAPTSQETTDGLLQAAPAEASVAEESEEDPKAAEVAAKMAAEISDNNTAKKAPKDGADDTSWMDALLCCLPANCFGLTGRSRRVALGLSLLGSLDAFGGGLVAGTLLAYYFSEKWHVGQAGLGSLLFIANAMASVSSLASGAIAKRLGLVNTMVFTHLPSNIATILIPIMPTLAGAEAMVFARYSLARMNIVPRQSYIASVVTDRERTVTIGMTNVCRTLGTAMGPTCTALLKQSGHFGAAFILAGSVKIVYDLLILAGFWSVKPDMEVSKGPAGGKGGDAADSKDKQEGIALLKGTGDAAAPK